MILPLVASYTDHAVSITVAIKDQMTLAIGCVIELSVRILLFILPLLTIMSWVAQSKGSVENSMTLHFDGFQSLALFGSVLLVNYIIQGGKSDW